MPMLNCWHPSSRRKLSVLEQNYVGDKKDLPDTQPEIPVFFYKPASSLIGSGAEVRIPEGVDEIKFESELAVVIGKRTKNIEENEVLDSILGYTVGNDVTAPQFFHEAGHWTVGKSFDTFTPLGPAIQTDLDPLNVYVKAFVNGEEKQNSKSDLMIVSLKRMVSYLSKVMTLEPGDVILTGSPLGAEFVKKGDKVECTIDEIGTLENTFTK
ncbi:fumarylacetoacetate hydrolase family protein [Sinobaca sp. H24]|uniref:fumarylacetoacetate hydrolase family protein n=1 Tax=Sinobaca sp. H24 TaxID=2923376 RepID=UPI0035B45BFA